MATPKVSAASHVRKSSDDIKAVRLAAALDYQRRVCVLKNPQPPAIAWAAVQAAHPDFTKADWLAVRGECRTFFSALWQRSGSGFCDLPAKHLNPPESQP